MPLTATPSDSHPATRSAAMAAEGGTSRAQTPGTTLPTKFRDCDGPVHKDTAGSPSQSRNYLHPTRGPTTTGYRRNAPTRGAGADDGAWTLRPAPRRPCHDPHLRGD